MDTNLLKTRDLLKHFKNMDTKRFERAIQFDSSYIRIPDEYFYPLYTKHYLNDKYDYFINNRILAKLLPADLKKIILHEAKFGRKVTIRSMGNNYMIDRLIALIEDFEFFKELASIDPDIARRIVDTQYAVLTLPRAYIEKLLKVTSGAKKN